ncbi:mannosyltransferase family protein [Ktedonospora formicarum]|uniref:Glycosyltransferase RgtA/B/C/D-like domain-containing protein n=1 Tax=Ktedonospora formicarum TaxID=2778364 RepID=A0A8J3I3Z5_9CHLR|nr:mannosyltransferase family protein [Ktedonospora formicarum]GHO47116.1 hypothetical protein KSX_52790 [Ktedonospora formicarum]
MDILPPSPISPQSSEHLAPTFSQVAGEAADTIVQPNKVLLVTELPTTPLVAISKDHFPSWKQAFKQALFLFGVTHLIYLFLTYLAALFEVKNFSKTALPLTTLLHRWDRWDTEHFTSIATQGYTAPWKTAFFPLYPFLESVVSFIIHDPFVAGLILANLASFGILMILYKLVAEDFGHEHASRTSLYLSLYPAAFFLAAAYNESLFLLCVLACFYALRHQQWWFAGICGLLASLTRSAGILLVVPFCYEYLRSCNFQWKKIRWQSLNVLLIPCGLGMFALYCGWQFHDPLAFSHAQSVWGRQFRLPPLGFISSLRLIVTNPMLTFTSIHNVIDLSAGLVIGVLVVLSFIGPWRFRQRTLAYALYGAVAFLFVIIFPSTIGAPLQSQMRLVMEVFPAFMVLAMMGKDQKVHTAYMLLSNGLMIFFLLQFLTGYWMV